MKRLITAVVISLSVLLAGCPSMPTSGDAAQQAQTLNVPKNPQQSVYATKHVLLAALSVVEDYQGLPVCKEGLVICRTASVQARLKTLSNTAVSALDEAEKLVRTPGFAVDTLATLNASAIAAVNALTAVTNTLKLR